MELKWSQSFADTHQLWWYEKRLRCAEISPQTGGRWALVLSYNVAPMDFTHERSRFDTLEEAKEYTENLVRIIIIGGHHEHT